jgi:hypothetical protein
LAAAYRAHQNGEAGIEIPAPILVAHDGTVVDGHYRVEAAKLAGLAHIECNVLPKSVSAARQRALAFNANFVGSMSLKKIDYTLVLFQLLESGLSPEQIVNEFGRLRLPRKIGEACLLEAHELYDIAVWFEQPHINALEHFEAALQAKDAGENSRCFVTRNGVSCWVM